MLYADSHVEFIHYPDDELLLPDPEFPRSQLNASYINAVQPDLLFLAVFVEPDAQAWQKMLWIIDRYMKVIQENDWKLVRSKKDLEEEGIKIILHIEDLFAIGEDLEKITTLYELGVRSIGLTHNQQNQFAGGTLTPQLGVSELGQEAISVIIGKGIILDGAHLSTQSFHDVMGQHDLVPFISHTGIYEVFNNPRNIDQHILSYVRERQGYVGVGMAGSFLGKEGVSLDDYIAQVDAALEIAGNEQVGIGSDLGGIVSYLPKELRDIRDIGILQGRVDQNVLGQNLHKFLRSSSLQAD